MEQNEPGFWPEKPTCHGNQSPLFRFGEVTWREPRLNTDGPYDYPFRTCSYCGSIHPADLLKALEAGAQLGGSDWKYGWPHKFYVEAIPNPKAGQPAPCGSRSMVEEPTEADRKQYQKWEQRDGRWHGTMIQPAPAHTNAKWYNEHLLDLSPEAFAMLAEKIKEAAGIHFELVDGKLHYSAPYRGYQR